MTVKELKEILDRMNENEEIIFKDNNYGFPICREIAEVYEGLNTIILI